MEITQVMRIGYEQGLIHQIQQKMSKLENTVRRVNQTGLETGIDRVGQTRPRKRTTRYADTPYIPTPFDRRWAMSDIWDWSDLISDDQKLEMMGDPTNEVSTAGAYGINREKDYVIYGALFADAPAGQKSTDGKVSFPSSQIIAHGANGLTFDKVNLTREMLDDAQHDDEDMRYFVVTAQQITNLLNEPKATSADYTTVRAIQDGKFQGTWMGFNWITLSSAIVDKVGAIRNCAAFTKNSVGFVKPWEIVGKIDQLPTKNYATQAFATVRMGAVRLEEKGVVQVQCQERA